MNRLLLRAGLLGALLVSLYVGWILLFPSPERIIQKRLARIAQLASVSNQEGPLARLANSQKLTSFCARDVEIRLEIPGRISQTLNGREELLQAVMAARSTLNPFKVEFLDVGVVVGGDKQSAVARLTAKASFPGERIPEVQELKFAFRRIDHDWVIQQAETVRTLH
jgi:hypothetical protein